jgi:hypothetical protein
VTGRAERDHHRTNHQNDPPTQGGDSVPA